MIYDDIEVVPHAKGVTCHFYKCREPAARKVEDDSPPQFEYDMPDGTVEYMAGHPLTAYLCKYHYACVMHGGIMERSE